MAKDRSSFRAWLASHSPNWWDVVIRQGRMEAKYIRSGGKLGFSHVGRDTYFYADRRFKVGLVSLKDSDAVPNFVFTYFQYMKDCAKHGVKPAPFVRVDKELAAERAARG